MSKSKENVLIYMHIYIQTSTDGHLNIYIYIYIYIYTDTYSHKNIIYLVIQVRLCFLTLYLKVFKLFALLSESGKLFQIEGPI